MKVTKAEEQRRALMIKKVKAELAAKLLQNVRSSRYENMVLLVQAFDADSRLKELNVDNPLEELEERLQGLTQHYVGFTSTREVLQRENAPLSLEGAVAKYVDVTCDDFVNHGGELWNLDLIHRVIGQYTGAPNGPQGDYLGRGLRPNDIDIYCCHLNGRELYLGGMYGTPSENLYAVYRRQNDGFWLLNAVKVDEDYLEFVVPRKRPAGVAP